MNYLLDVNVLLAWGWADHADHRRAASWIASMKRKRATMLLTSAIPELGFVRVSVQRAQGRVAVGDAVATLASMLGSLGACHDFLPDDRSSSTGFPDWCSGASSTTDAHLFALAKAHGAMLATMGGGIPGAMLLPQP
ncbi:MAG: hypothetical protein B9S38_08605 [Verrucomicrobiia bacterium Tous-C4TDCM]|nr:MAG: hypothetical protein B9S38_08605 [Verrucomicrobiae bacterium Tous-C4TDCM]